MMAFARTWDASYEATPPTAQAASQGATRIQELKIDIRERLDIDHKWAGDAEDGEHEKVTLEQRVAPAAATDKVVIYAKDFNSKAELHTIDEDSNEVRLTQAGTIALLQLGNAWLKSQATAEKNLTFATPLVIDSDSSNAFRCTLTGNFTLAVPTGGKDGQVVTLRLIQDATGSRIISYNAALLGDSGDDLVLSTGALDEDLMTLYCDSALAWHIVNLKKDFANSAL